MGYKDRDKQRQYQNLWKTKRRTEWLNANGPCVKCGSWEDLEIDHKNRADKVSHKIWSLTKEKRDAELAKCQVLCGVCHKEKTAIELSVELVHGTMSGYKTHNCKCYLCKSANAKYEHSRRIEISMLTA